MKRLLMSTIFAILLTPIMTFNNTNNVDFFYAMYSSATKLQNEYIDPVPFMGYGPLVNNAKMIIERAYLFKQQYEFARSNKNQPLNKIPKIIHQIWIGNKPIPQVLNFCIKSVKKCHPDWTYMLWDNNSIKNLSLMYSDLIQDNNIDIGKRADILRFELLRIYGGVYLDIDTFCHKSMNDLIENYSYFCGITSEMYCTGVSPQGAAPNHPIIAKYLDELNIPRVKTPGNCVLQATGSIYLTEKITDYLKSLKFSDENILIAPRTYFHAFPGLFRESFWDGALQIDALAKFERKETYQSHIWATTWYTDRNLIESKLRTLLKQNNLISTGDIKELINKYQPSNQMTPAIIAAKNNSHILLDYLCRFGADLELKDLSGKTALDYARQFHNIRCIDIINQCI